MTGGILQSLDAVTWKAIRSTGGWVEGFVYLKPNLHSHTGMFIDDPNDDDITAIPNSLFGRTYNSAYLEQCALGCDKELPHRVRGDPSSNRVQGTNQPAQPRIRFPYPVRSGPSSAVSSVLVTADDPALQRDEGLKKCSPIS